MLSAAGALTATRFAQQFRKTGKICRHPPRLVLEQHTGRLRHQGISPEIEPSDRLAAGILHPEGLGVREGETRPATVGAGATGG
jgi:hypothetical protein